jgi:hypothetical protein
MSITEWRNESINEDERNLQSKIQTDNANMHPILCPMMVQ